MINGWVTANSYAANAGSTTTATDPATVAASTAEASTAQASTAAAASTAAEASTAAPLSTPEPPATTGGTVPPATSTPGVVVVVDDLTCQSLCSLERSLVQTILSSASIRASLRLVLCPGAEIEVEVEVEVQEAMTELATRHDDLLDYRVIECQSHHRRRLV
jgi:hypothetical protein